MALNALNNFVTASFHFYSSKNINSKRLDDAALLRNILELKKSWETTFKSYLRELGS